MGRTGDHGVGFPSGLVALLRVYRNGPCIADLEDSVQAAEADEFHVGELVESVARALLAETGEFDAAEGGLARRHQAIVDAQQADVHRLGHPPASTTASVNGTSWTGPNQEATRRRYQACRKSLV